MYMVMLVLDDSTHLDGVLEAWDALGVSGATFVESTGRHRRQTEFRRVHARYDYGRLKSDKESGNYTLFAIVPDEAVARQCLTAAERVVGDLDGPNTGVLAAWPLAVVKGVPPSVRAREAG